ncbi:MAG: cupin [Paracoccaceae bacterium]
MKCQRFSFVSDLREVVPDGLYMQAVVGEALSVGVVNFRLPGGPGIAAKAHSHGEEASLQIRGGCTVNLGDDPARPEGAVELEEGVLMLMPADHPHSGINRYDAAGQCLRLNVVTPPRAEFGNRGAAQTFYPADAAQGGR